jgi:hemerythrin-like domain-containing protein
LLIIAFRSSPHASVPLARFNQQRSQAMKATEMLKRQHRDVKKLFGRAKKADAGEREQILEEIETNLRMHMHIEETIFYPAVREHSKAKKTQEMIGEAYEEHDVVKLVLNTFATLDPEDERFEAKMTVLDELIQHHVEEEEGEMFPAAEKMGAEELNRLAEEMEAAAGEAEAGAAAGEEEDEEEDDSFEPGEDDRRLGQRH